MKKLLLFIALLSNVTVFGQYGLQVIVKPMVPSVNDSVFCIINTLPISGDCKYALEKKEINGSKITIDASFDSGCKCMNDGMHDTIPLGKLPEGKYTISFTVTDKNTTNLRSEDNICIVPFQVIDFSTFEVIELATSVNQKSSTPDAVLYQNTPNPFSAKTELKYSVPESAEKAVINVYALNGNMLLSKPITQTGSGGITVNGSELEAGTYIYTLLVNGVEVDSKRMILTK
jgi:hypothetical protein